MAQDKNINIDPTADVHPTVLLEGKVTIGPFSKIDASTIISGNVTTSLGYNLACGCLWSSVFFSTRQNSSVIRSTVVMGSSPYVNVELYQHKYT